MIIGLVGRSRVGKDTAAEFLSGTHKVLRLSQPVKDACKVLYGWSDVEVEGPAKEEIDDRHGITPRVAMVHLTQSIRAFMDAEFFTRRFFDAWDGLTPIVIPDVRYEHDIRAIRQKGGITIKITRSSGPQHQFEFGIDSHEADYEISNDGTVEEFKNKIMNIITSGSGNALKFERLV